MADRKTSKSGLDELAVLQNELKHKQRFIEHLLTASPNLVYLYDLSGKNFTFFNRGLLSFLGYKEGAMEQTQSSLLESLIHPDDVSLLRLHFEDCSSAKDGDVLEAEYRLKHAYGEWHWFAVRETVYKRTPDGQVWEILGVAEDITERRRDREKIWYISTHDALTGLYNRAYFEEEIARLERGRRFPISVLIADVDGLQQVNDTLGTAAGDLLLCNTGEILRACFRAEDVVARIGGDEFGALLPDISAVSIEAIFVRVARRLELYNQSHPKTPLHFSIGIASAERGDSLRNTVKEAEQRM
ncbi:diguanylate cyclase, partial [bacterium]|nr:diguanylate cyclase [bacterium]